MRLFTPIAQNMPILTLMDTLIIIPARAGSSFKGKNRYPLSGRDLYKYTFDASQIEEPHDTLVTSDDHYILAEAEQRGFKTHRRKASLCNATATLDAVMAEIAKEFEYKTYICLPPTSPLRTSTHVAEALKQYRLQECDSLISAKEELKSIWRVEEGGYARPIVERLKNRQQSEPVFICNGAIFISSREVLLKHKRRMAGHVGIYLMTERESLDVHTMDDIKMGEFFLNDKSR